VTFDRAIGVIAAVAGVVAAFYAVKAYVSSRDTSIEQQRQRAKDIRPRPVVTEGTHRGGMSEWQVIVVNAGGAVVQGLVVVRSVNSVYEGPLTLGAHTPPGALHMRRVGTTAVAVGFTVLILLAQDTDAHWWNVLAGERLDVAWDSPDNTDCRAWIDQQLPPGMTSA
jgi:hypothetical protein